MLFFPLFQFLLFARLYSNYTILITIVCLGEKQYPNNSLQASVRDVLGFGFYVAFFDIFLHFCGKAEAGISYSFSSIPL
jgi:hypothetical protein